MKADIACPLRLKKGLEGNIARGFPWVYADEIIESSEAMFVPPGSLVSVENHKGNFLGIGYFNPASTIACRMLTLKREAIDVAFFRARLELALKARQTAFTASYYRLAHSEPDFLPGLLFDRFAERVVVQVGTAGMEALLPLWIQALNDMIAPSSIILRNDIASRTKEGLEQFVKVIGADVPELVEVHENGCIYLADLLRGQKTGWFYDHRDNRRMIADMARGKTVLDVYSHSGGFGLLAAKAGSAQVTLADSSKLALGIAAKAVALNGLSNVDYLQDDAFKAMEQLHRDGRSFDIVCADPPAFVKNKKDVAAGMKGYEKVARLAAALVAPGGHLFMASCSHHAARPKFNQAVLKGAKAAGFTGKILKQTGASSDHPRHPALPQSEYLKGVLLG